MSHSPVKTLSALFGRPRFTANVIKIYVEVEDLLPTKPSTQKVWSSATFRENYKTYRWKTLYRKYKFKLPLRTLRNFVFIMWTLCKTSSHHTRMHCVILDTRQCFDETQPKGANLRANLNQFKVNNFFFRFLGWKKCSKR